jgi:hypothetical protein
MSHLIGFLRMGHKHQGLYSSLISRLGLLIFKLFRRGPDQLKELVYSVAIMSYVLCLSMMMLRIPLANLRTVPVLSTSLIIVRNGT